MKERVLDEVKRTFSPEFLNRLDEVVVFRALTKEDTGAIAVLMVKKLVDRIKKESGLNVCVDDAAIQVIAEEGYDPNMGARPLRRTIQKRIEDGLAEEILRRGSLASVLVTAEGDEIVFKDMVRESEPVG